eukprot:NODE_504_length_6695_cov_1.218163.p1 type:complete len:1130 gc:universal NODE_504_length_6695_cov_1.218163:2793-6182(+)
MPFDPVAFNKEAHEHITHDQLKNITAPHIDSFNALNFVYKKHHLGSEPLYIQNIPNILEKDSLLKRAIDDISKQSILDPNGNLIEFAITGFQWDKPHVPQKLVKVVEKRLFPNECRQRRITYKSSFKISLNLKVMDIEETMTLDMGEFPIMTGSHLCHLHQMNPTELIRHHEDLNEMGGTFIVNGNEKLIRLLIATKRNHPFGLMRPSFTNRGKLYTDKAIMIRSVKPDQTSLTNYLHYLSNGACNLRFHWLKAEYLIPVGVVLKALTGNSDFRIFKDIISDIDDSYVTSQIEQVLRDIKQFQGNTTVDYLQILGQRFKAVMNLPVCTDEEAGRIMIQRCVLCHLDNFEDKYNMLILMIKKLYALTTGACQPDDMDATQNHEVLLGGHLYGAIIKEQLEQNLLNIKIECNKLFKTTETSFSVIRKLIQKKGQLNIGKKLEYFLATGNLMSKSGLDQLALSGYTIVAEKLNFYRYLAHFRCIHRGQVFADSKSTSMRKLKPESFGFLCCVHTPDGAPCGLLTHLTHCCEIINFEVETLPIVQLLNSLGMSSKFVSNYNPICLDGKILGYASPDECKAFGNQLRIQKFKGNIPQSLEIGYIPSYQFPGLFLFTNMARMIRPVQYLIDDMPTDWVGPFEQVYIDILCVPDTDINSFLINDELVTIPTHKETTPVNMLSIVANMTPYSDYNQSPRNMYQCQMGKQTSGTPCLNLANRTDNKMYRLNTGQSPIVRPKMYDAYGLDDYPQGTNAVVAVISYTSYDMEDAMIINKFAHERGIGASTIYKTEFVDLNDKFKDGSYFFFNTSISHLDKDGLPFLNTLLKQGDALCSCINDSTHQIQTVKYKGMEDAYVDQVRLLGDGIHHCTQVQITLRIPRPTITGDKWSSRHGQKGVNSLKYPCVDLPFSESGMQPDIIINPNAFPSRMTIGMFVESMAGKAGALNGKYVDATPFQKQDMVETFGSQLLENGYNYFGNETMYSGITGEELEADIYIGVVYYQRLRHMVSDKYQVRTTGPVDRLTKQPIKGRKRSGGIRFGEMERDSLLAHGTSFMLQDRLLNCSDLTIVQFCQSCGSFLNVSVQSKSQYTGKLSCQTCDTDAHLCCISIPYVLKYFASELASMNIKMNFKVREAVY